MPNFDEYVELELMKINDQYWALQEKHADGQLQQEAEYSYIGHPYKVKSLGSVKIPYEYLERFATKKEWLL